MTEQNKDIFNLSETSFYNFFREELTSKIHFSRFKAILEMLYSWLCLGLIFIIVSGMFSFFDYHFYSYMFPKLSEFLEKNLLHGLFLIFCSAFWAFIQILFIWMIIKNIITVVKHPNYKIKQILFSALNIKYSCSQKKYNGKNKVKYEMFLIPEYIQKALRKIFISSNGRQTFRYPFADEGLFFNYKDLPLEIVEFQYSKDSKGFSNAIVVATKINKKFKGEVIINEKISGLRPAVEIKPQVFLEAPEFFSKFKVFADDQIEARYLLTTAFIDRMLNYKNSHNCNIDILFSNSLCKDKNIFICISSKKNFFEFPFFSKWDKEPTILYGFLKEIKQIAEVVDALKLDQDIGM